MTIIPLEKPDVRATAKLVKRVFPFQSPLEGLTFWAYTNQEKAGSAGSWAFGNQAVG
jgi:hypothetical protein